MFHFREEARSETFQSKADLTNLDDYPALFSTNSPRQLKALQMSIAKS